MAGTLGHPRSGPSTIFGIFALGTMLAGAWLAVIAYGAAQLGPTSRGAFVADYDGRVLDDGLELLIIQSDGQAYATLARDPTMRRAEESFRTSAEAAYRAQRPLLGWLAWLGSLGRTGWVPPALAVLAAGGAGAAAAAAGLLLRRRRRTPWLGLLVLAMPGTMNALSFLGPEPLMLALVLAGLFCWEEDHDRYAVACFCVAVLTRESAILVPAGLGLITVWRHEWSRTVRLLLVPMTLASYDLLLRIRFGTWPWEASDGRLGPPLAGFLEAVPERWETPVQNTALVALAVLVVVGAVSVARHDDLTVIIGVHAAFATLMGRYVWEEIPGFGRVLLPMFVLGIIAVAGAIFPPATEETEGAEPPRRSSRATL